MMTWQARKFPPATNGSVLHAPASYYNTTTLLGGGAKHSSMLYCPLNGRMYVFGGDRSGYASDSDKAAGLASDDYHNDIWSYDAATDNWRNETTWDVADGEIHPWRPDWGMFAWDSKRNVFWYRPGGSNGAFQGGGSFRYASSSGLTWTYGGGRLMPDKTMVPGGALTLPDNAASRVYYDAATHIVYVVSGTPLDVASGIPLYDVTMTGGKLTACVNLRPYWMTYGVYTDEVVDCRHYANPTHLICFDPLTAKWSDPGLAVAEDQITTDVQPDGRRYVHEWRNACMIYDAGGDQLVWIGAASGTTSATVHYSFAANKWTRYTGTPSTNLSQARHWFNEADRKIYCIDPSGQFAPFKTTCVAWTYHVDTHAWSAPVAIPGCQSGSSLWPFGGGVGTPTGGMQSFSVALGDPANDCIWFPEVTNPLLCTYGYENDGALVNLHKWYYKESPWRFEIAPTTDAAPGNHTHGIVTGFDPVNKLILTYGQNSGNPANPVSSLPYMYSLSTDSGVTPIPPEPPMAQVTIYNNDPTNVTVTVINGDPPNTAALEQQVADLTAANAALQTKYDNYVTAVRAEAQAAKDADAAKVDGQSILDIPV